MTTTHNTQSTPLDTAPKLEETSYAQSCDFCAHQEGRHYCLLHECSVKNMDAVRCEDWRERTPLDTAAKVLSHAFPAAKYLIQRPFYPEWFAGWNMYSLARWTSEKSYAAFVPIDELEGTLIKIPEKMKPIAMLVPNPKGGDAPCVQTTTRHCTGAAQSDPEAAPKCTLCGDVTNIVFNIRFRATPVCESCATAITHQQVTALTAPVSSEDNSDLLNSEIRTQRGRIVE